MKYSFFLIMLILTSCTHNNGDIGYLFGMWKVTSIKYYGNDYLENDNNYICFQNEVVCLRKLLDNYKTEECYGLFKHYNDSLFFDFYEINLNLTNQFMFNKKGNKLQTRNINKKTIMIFNDSVEWRLEKY